MKPNNEITADEMKVLRGLRDRGFSVVVWTPQEVGKASVDDLEDAVISYGNDFLDYLNRGD